MKQRNCCGVIVLMAPSFGSSQYFYVVGKGVFMYQKFCIGFFVAAFVCGLMFCFSATTEASVLGSIPDIQCAVAPALVKPIANFVILLITVAAFFL